MLALARPTRDRREPPRKAVALDLAEAEDMLLVGVSARRLANELMSAGCVVRWVPDLRQARAALALARFRVVVIDQMVGGEDGVSFAVEAKLGRVPGTQVQGPFFILPEPGGAEFVVYRAYEDITAGSLGGGGIAAAVLDLLMDGPTS